MSPKSSRSNGLHGRRSFLKMLGLGGVAATGLTSGSKLLGGIVSEPDEAKILELYDGGIISSAELQDKLIPKLWAEESLKALQEQAAVSKEIRNYEIEPLARGVDHVNVNRNAPVVTVDAGGKQSTFQLEGTIQHSHEQEAIFVQDQGSLGYCVPGIQWVECYMEGRLEWMRGEIVTELIRSNGHFDMLVEYNDKTLEFKECLYTDMMYDLSVGDVSITFKCGEMNVKSFGTA